jgi:hypothetical protein
MVSIIYGLQRGYVFSSSVHNRFNNVTTTSVQQLLRRAKA